MASGNREQRVAPVLPLILLHHGLQLRQPEAHAVDIGLFFPVPVGRVAIPPVVIVVQGKGLQDDGFRPLIVQRFLHVEIGLHRILGIGGQDIALHPGGLKNDRCVKSRVGMAAAHHQQLHLPLFQGIETLPGADDFIGRVQQQHCRLQTGQQNQDK